MISERFWEFFKMLSKATPLSTGSLNNWAFFKKVGIVIEDWSFAPFGSERLEKLILVCKVVSFEPPHYSGHFVINTATLRKVRASSFFNLSPHKISKLIQFRKRGKTFHNRHIFPQLNEKVIIKRSLIHHEIQVVWLSVQFWPDRRQHWNKIEKN